MSRSWPYSRLSQMAKRNGGPEELIKIIASANYEKGIKEGIKIGFEEGVKSRNPYILVAAVTGGVVAATASVITYNITKSKTRNRVEMEFKTDMEDAREAEEELLRQYKELQLENEKLLNEIDNTKIKEEINI